jgi:hypothetical protein
VCDQKTGTTDSSGASGPVCHSAPQRAERHSAKPHASRQRTRLIALRAKQGHFTTDRVHGVKHALRNGWFLCGLPLEVECSWPSAQVSVFSASHIQFTPLHSATLRPCCTCVSLRYLKCCLLASVRQIAVGFTSRRRKQRNIKRVKPEFHLNII